MALRIACDLDGTLADMDTALQREAERLFGPGVDLRANGGAGKGAAGDTVRLKPDATTAQSRGANTGRRGLTRVELRQLWAHVGTIENFWTTLQEIEPGAVAKLAALASLHGWEVIFLTQRPASAGDTAQLQSQRWLEAHGFRYPSVFVLNGSRGRVADALALDAVVDDRPENCLDVVSDSKATSILIWRDVRPTPPTLARLPIVTTRSFAEAVEQLQRLMPPIPSGLVARVRRAVGV
jgi:hypothetical protein